MTGLIVFAVGVVAGVGSVYGLAIRTTTQHGLRAAKKEAVVTGGSLAAYVVICVWLGYGIPQQILGCLAGGAVLWFGRSWIPALAERGRHDAEA